MRVSKWIGIVMVGMLLALAGCGAAGTASPAAPTAAAAGGGNSAPAETAAEETRLPAASPDSGAMVETATEAASAQNAAPADAAYAGPAWASLPLVNARTGETFTLADFAGKTVYVHMMATWCGNCRAAQTILRTNVVGEFSSEDVVFVSIDVQTQLSAGDLAAYADNNSFGWVFAVATPDFLRAAAADLGSSVTTPPSTPHFVLRPTGAVVGLLMGSRPAVETVDLLRGIVAG